MNKGRELKILGRKEGRGEKRKGGREGKREIEKRLETKGHPITKLEFLKFTLEMA